MANYVKVANPKHYALTQGKPYEVKERKQNRIVITNDNNVDAPYALDLFFNKGKNLSEAQLQQALEQFNLAAPKAKFPEVAEALKTLKYNIGDGNITFTVGEKNHEVALQLGNSGTDVSGAMRQIYNINGFYETLTEYIENNVEGANAAWRAKFVDGAFQRGVKTLMENVQDAVRYFIASTNCNHADFERVNKVLQPMTVAGDVKPNPKTGNNIKVWLLAN